MIEVAMIHVLTVKSESCDDYGPFTFAHRLDEQETLDFLREVVPEPELNDVVTFNPDEDTWDGPGWAGTYLHLTQSVSPVTDSAKV
ncbi:MAG: hypothetical protein WCV86_05495 [Patescibacteria group bacterium]|jgi:hypothetical protein